VCRLETPLRVEDLEDAETDGTLHPEVVLRPRSRRDESPPDLSVLLMSDVVLRAPLGIAKDAVRLMDQAEATRIAGLLIVRVEMLRKMTIHTMDRLWFRIGADLKRLVVVVRTIHRYQDLRR
jgi:hypothetical protein